MGVNATKNDLKAKQAALLDAMMKATKQVKVARQENIKLKALQAQRPPVPEEIEIQLAKVKTALADLLTAQHAKVAASENVELAFTRLESTEKQVMKAREARATKLEAVARDHQLSFSHHLNAVQADRSQLANAHWSSATSSVAALRAASADLQKNSKEALSSISATVTEIQGKLKEMRAADISPDVVNPPQEQGPDGNDKVAKDPLEDTDSVLDKVLSIGKSSLRNPVSSDVTEQSSDITEQEPHSIPSDPTTRTDTDTMPSLHEIPKVEETAQAEGTSATPTQKEADMIISMRSQGTPPIASVAFT